MASKESEFRFILGIVFVLVSRSAGDLANPESTADEVRLQALGAANNQLALLLHRNLSHSTPRNFVFSPWSIFIVLAMMYKGAQGDTAKELRTFLYRPSGLSDGDIQSAIQRFSTEVSKPTKYYSLLSANLIVIDDRLRLFPEYKVDMEFQFGASFMSADFEASGTGERVVAAVNDWVSHQTIGKIPHLLDNLSPDTVAAFFNAVYFNGFWERAFDPHSTRRRLFFNHGLTAKRVPMMSASGSYLLASTADLEAIEMPYKGDDLAMLILLPKQRNGLPGLEQRLTVANISTIRSSLQRHQADVSLPKFKIEFANDFTETLKGLGLQTALSERANFSAMVQQQGMRLQVSCVEHKAVIDVNEKGTEAAAVTGSVIRHITVHRHFKVDHPFLFAVIEKKSELVFFLGRVIRL